MTMFDYAKDALYESASTNFVVNNDGDEELHIVYERTDVKRIADLFSVSFDALNDWWLDFLGLEA